MKALRLLTVSVCLFVTLSVTAQTYDAQLRDFETFVEAEMKASQIPGLSIAVMKDDFTWSKGFGFADVENRVPATAESSYRLASITKPMTATAVMKLVEEGKIDLDAEVQKYVPSFPRKPWPITVRQLLGHLGGISHYRDTAVESHFKEPKNTAQSLAVFGDFDLVAEPGTRFSYTTYGYVLLGAILESAAGKPYGQVLREKVWAPLGMNATRMDDMSALIPNRVRGYELFNGKLRHSEYVDVSSRFAGGGTRSTVLDMIAFVRGLNEGKVLRPETLDMMWTAQTTRDGQPTGYGLGWDVTPSAGRFRVYHDGSQPETETQLYFFPRANFAIAMASNLEDANLYPFAQRLASIFLGDAWTYPARIRGSESEVKTGIAILRAFNSGLAYYDRYGKAATTDARDLFKALEDGSMTRDQATRLGSYVAKSFGANVDRYHREGPFAFFADYQGSPKLSPKLRQQIERWRDDWARTSSIANFTEFLRVAPTIENATVVPDFSGVLVANAQQSALRGDIAGAMKTAKTAVTFYPDSESTNGLWGTLLIVAGDAQNGEAAVRKSAALNPNGFFGPANVLRIAGFLANGPTRPAAIKVLTIARDLYPNDVAIAKTLKALQ